MEALFGPVMLVGKYVFLALVYGFLYWAFRGLFAQAAVEARSQRAGAAPQPPVVPAREATMPRVPAPTVAVPAAPPVVAPAGAPEPPPAPVEPGLSREEPPLVLGTPSPPFALLKPALIVQDAGKSTLEPGQAIELTAAITIGRADDNGLVVDDKFCSTHHALIYLQRGQRLLRDRESTNGTYHNGQIISDDVMLLEGDCIGVGTVVFRYRAGNS